jgi:hypothetical protein
VVIDAAEDVGEPSFRINVVELRGRKGDRGGGGSPTRRPPQAGCSRAAAKPGDTAPIGAARPGSLPTRGAKPLHDGRGKAPIISLGRGAHVGRIHGNFTHDDFRYRRPDAALCTRPLYFHDAGSAGAADRDPQQSTELGCKQQGDKIKVDVKKQDPQASVIALRRSPTTSSAMLKAMICRCRQ